MIDYSTVIGNIIGRYAISDSFEPLTNSNVDAKSKLMSYLVVIPKLKIRNSFSHLNFALIFGRIKHFLSIIFPIHKLYKIDRHHVILMIEFNISRSFVSLDLEHRDQNYLDLYDWRYPT